MCLMSRTPTNPKVSDLLYLIGEQWQCHARMRDVATAIGCTRHQIHRYTTARKRLPRVEAAIATEAGLSIHELRRLLGLDSHSLYRDPKNPNPRSAA